MLLNRPKLPLRLKQRRLRQRLRQKVLSLQRLQRERHQLRELHPLKEQFRELQPHPLRERLPLHRGTRQLQERLQSTRILRRTQIQQTRPRPHRDQTPRPENQRRQETEQLLQAILRPRPVMAQHLLRAHLVLSQRSNP